jgi:hypothetical protein
MQQLGNGKATAKAVAFHASPNIIICCDVEMGRTDVPTSNVMAVTEVACQAAAIATRAIIVEASRHLTSQAESIVQQAGWYVTRAVSPSVPVKCASRSAKANTRLIKERRAAACSKGMYSFYPLASQADRLVRVGGRRQGRKKIFEFCL